MERYITAHPTNPQSGSEWESYSKVLVRNQLPPTRAKCSNCGSFELKELDWQLSWKQVGCCECSNKGTYSEYTGFLESQNAGIIEQPYNCIVGFTEQCHPGHDGTEALGISVHKQSNFHIYNTWRWSEFAGWIKLQKELVVKAECVSRKLLLKELDRHLNNPNRFKYKNETPLQLGFAGLRSQIETYRPKLVAKEI